MTCKADIVPNATVNWLFIQIWNFYEWGCENYSHCRKYVPESCV